MEFVLFKGTVAALSYIRTADRTFGQAEDETDGTFLVDTGIHVFSKVLAMFGVFEPIEIHLDPVGAVAM